MSIFSCCTEIVSNPEPRNEVRTELWHLCTVPPLQYTVWLHLYTVGGTITEIIFMSKDAEIRPNS